jgi:hypothetical protein
MNPVLKRIHQSFQFESPTDSSPQAIATSISQLSPLAREKLISHHSKLNMEYSILCAKIASEWRHTAPNKALMKEQIDAALSVATLLEAIYQHYLDVPREVVRLKKERQTLKALQQKLENPSVAIKEEAAAVPQTYLSKTIREKTSSINLHRLFNVRLRRLVITSSRLMNNDSPIRLDINDFDNKFTGPFFSHLAWLYFIPRISVNVSMILKHTIPHDGMSKEEKALSWQTRLKIQLQARWPDLSNDVPWLIANTISCFVLVGPLLPYAITFSICMQVYEMAQASMLYYVEITNLKEQRIVYEKQLKNLTPGSDEYCQTQSYIAHMDARIKHESKRLMIAVINTSVLLLAIVLAAPCFSPICAVIGAAIAVLSTIIAYQARVYREKRKPDSNLSQFLSQTNHPVFSHDNDPIDQTAAPQTPLI